MSEPFIGEIRMVGFNYAPQNWALCNGQLLPISQYAALFSLLGTYYGGNGTTSFALPDLRGRVPLSMGQGAGLSNYEIGQNGGTEAVTLVQPQMPAHSHSVAVNNSLGSTANPTNAFPAEFYTGDPRNPSLINGYATSSNANLAPTAVSTVGGSQPHENRQPYLAVNFIIALYGIFPPRN
jgi:microcystin-dependent protein